MGREAVCGGTVWFLIKVSLFDHIIMATCPHLLLNCILVYSVHCTHWPQCLAPCLARYACRVCGEGM